MIRHHLIYLTVKLSAEKIRSHQFKDKNIFPLLELVLKIFALD